MQFKNQWYYCFHLITIDIQISWQNIVGFLLAQSLQFDIAIRSLARSKDELDQARLVYRLSP